MSLTIFHGEKSRRDFFNRIGRKQFGSLLSELYVILDVPEDVLDQVWAAVEGDPLPHSTLLPFETK